jgi:hypothetical protein
MQDRTRLPVAAVSSATAQPGSGVAPVAEPAAAAPLQQIDMRAIESACDTKLASGVYLVDQNDFNCVDSGCSLEAMTGPGNPAVYDIEELSDADQLSVVGVGGTSRLKQRGKMQCCVPAEVVNAKPELEQLMRQIARDVICRESHGALSVLLLRAVGLYQSDAEVRTHAYVVWAFGSQAGLDRDA